MNQIRRAHSAVGGLRRGRRYATQQVNYAYLILLAAQFQGFCRELHAECVDHVLTVLAPPPQLAVLLRAELTRDRRLDRGNAHPSSLGVDFGRIGVDLWGDLFVHDARSVSWKASLQQLNEWRNAIAHDDFTGMPTMGIMTVRLREIAHWRAHCSRLAWGMDQVLKAHLQRLTGASPW